MCAHFASLVCHVMSRRNFPFPERREQASKQTFGLVWRCSGIEEGLSGRGEGFRDAIGIAGGGIREGQVSLGWWGVLLAEGGGQSGRGTIGARIACHVKSLPCRVERRDASALNPELSKVRKVMNVEYAIDTWLYKNHLNFKARYSKTEELKKRACWERGHSSHL